MQFTADRLHGGGLGRVCSNLVWTWHVEVDLRAGISASGMLALEPVGLKVAVWLDGSEYLNRLVDYLRVREFEFEVCAEEAGFPVGFGLILIADGKQDQVPADFEAEAVWVAQEPWVPREMSPFDNPFAYCVDPFESLTCLVDPSVAAADDPLDVGDDALDTCLFDESTVQRRIFLQGSGLGLDGLYLRLRDAELGLSDVCYGDTYSPVEGPRFLRRRSSTWVYEEVECQLEDWVASDAEVCFLNVPRHDVSWHKLLERPEVRPEVLRAKAERFQALLNGKLAWRIFLVHPSRELLAKWMAVLKDTRLEVVAFSDWADYSPLMLSFLPSFVIGSSELNSNARCWCELIQATNLSHVVRWVEVNTLEERVPEALLPFILIEIERAGYFLTLQYSHRSDSIQRNRLDRVLMKRLDQLCPRTGGAELLHGLDEVFSSSRACAFESDWDGSWRIRLDNAQVSWSNRTFVLEFDGARGRWSVPDVYFCHTYLCETSVSICLRWAESMLTTRERRLELSLKSLDLVVAA